MRKEVAGGAPRTSLASGINTTDLALTLASGTGYPTGASYPFVLVIDPGLATEEKVLCTSRSGANVTISASGRGFDNTTAQTHASGAFVDHVLDAALIEELQAFVHGTGVVTAGHLAANAVTTAKITDANVTLAKLATDSVDAAKIVASGVGASELAANAVTTAKVADDAVTYAKIQNVSVTDRLLGRDTAAAGDIEELTVGGGIAFTGTGGIQTAAFTGDVTKAAGGTATTIAANAVTTAKILDDAVTAAKVADGAIDAMAKITTALLDEIFQHDLLDVAVDTDATVSEAAFATWLNHGTVTVPAWATRCILHLDISGITDITAANNDYQIQILIGTDALFCGHFEGIGTLGPRFSINANGDLALTSTGSKALVVQAKKISGSGQFRADGNAQSNISMVFLP